MQDRKQGNWKEIPIPVYYLWTTVECSNFFIDCCIYGLLRSVVDLLWSKADEMKSLWNWHLEMIKIESSPDELGSITKAQV